MMSGVWWCGNEQFLCFGWTSAKESYDTEIQLEIEGRA
jgi:hypothetical protein